MSLMFMAKEKIQMPQSTAGLIRYFEQSDQAIKLNPEYVIIISIIIIAVELGLRFFI